MRRIAVSQRVLAAQPRAERRDALDQAWGPCLEALGLLAVPVPNALRDPQAWALALQIDGLLLTGGNHAGGDPAHHADAAPERDATEGQLLHLAQARRWPVLAVCRGLQMLNLHLGGQLVPVEGHVAQRHALQRLPGAGPLLRGLPDALEVNSFHQFGIAPGGLAPALQAGWADAAGQVEAAEHRQLPWLGIMWHPERETALRAHDRHLIHSLFTPPPP
jgi:putative glutamine amidotransferase